MARPKKRKPQQKPSQPTSRRKTGARCAALLSAAARDATPAKLQALYGVDEDGLADLPESASMDETDLYRAMLYMPMDALTAKGMPSTALSGELKVHSRAMMAGFHMAASLCLAFVLMPDDYAGAKNCGEVFDAMAPVEKAMPDAFYDPDPSSQNDKLVNRTFTDPFVTGVSAMIEWDEILEKDSIADWCRDFARIARDLATEERVADLDRRAAKIRTAAVEWVRDNLMPVLRQADSTMADIRIRPDMSRQQPRSAPIPENSPLAGPSRLERRLAGQLPLDLSAMAGRAPMISVPLPAGAGLSRRRLPDGMDTEPELKAPAWMRPLMALTYLCDSRHASAMVHCLQSEFRYEEIAWAGISALADAGPQPTCLQMLLACGAVTSRFVFPPMVDAYIDPEQSGADLVLDTFARRPVPARAIRWGIDHEDDDLEEMKRDGAALWEVISGFTGLQPSPMVRIRMGFEQDFLDMGLDARSAAAACGYMEGLSAGKVHLDVSSMYLDRQDRGRRTSRVPAAQAVVPGFPRPAGQDESRLDALKSEYEERIARLRDKADEDLHKATAELKRSGKTAQHRLMTAEERIAELEAANEALATRNKRLESEKARMDLALVDLTVGKDLPEEPERDDGKDLPSWPCNAGSDCVIRFYGGNDNTIAELTRRFPDVEFSPAWRVPNPDSIAGADIIIVDTHNMKHKMWYPIKNAMDKAGKRPVLCPTRGINSCSRTILDAYADWKSAIG